MHVDLDSALSFPSHLFWRGHLIGGEWGENSHEALSMREAAFFFYQGRALWERAGEGIIERLGYRYFELFSIEQFAGMMRYFTSYLSASLSDTVIHVTAFPHLIAVSSDMNFKVRCHGA